jgi:hypothetical protein
VEGGGGENDEEKRRIWMKELDHEDGYELKEKDGRSWLWKRREAGDHGRKSLIMKSDMSWRKMIEALEHEKGEEQEIMEERAWLWNRRRAEGKKMEDLDHEKEKSKDMSLIMKMDMSRRKKRWKLFTMKKKRSRRSWKKDLDYEDGDELKDKDGRSWPWKKRGAGDHGRKSLTMK